MALDQDVNTPDARPRGRSTAVGINLEYRLGIVRDLGVLDGEWLDCGCAEGAYTRGLREFGADSVVGLDVEESRVEEARARTDDPQVSYVHGVGERLPFDGGSFDGVYINEVLEHVADEGQTLGEIHRVLRGGGHVVVMSPNRWFPFEGHGLQLGSRKFAHPAPLVPWLPERLTRPALRARNYWPSKLRKLVADAGFEVTASGSVFPVFEQYPWLPRSVVVRYQRSLPRLAGSRVVSRFGVSTYVLGRKG
jgi:ubiquinone/menaquinone biosynthesis C-methylase UbiE